MKALNIFPKDLLRAFYYIHMVFQGIAKLPWIFHTFRIWYGVENLIPCCGYNEEHTCENLRSLFALVGNKISHPEICESHLIHKRTRRLDWEQNDMRLPILTVLGQPQVIGIKMCIILLPI